MKTYRLEFTQLIDTDIKTAWNFFSSPLNLEKITPDDMSFDVTSPYSNETKMYAGMIITYKVSPLFGIKLNWMTEIKHVKENEYFVDEQRFGPFALWHHQHHFKPTENGILMTDILYYAIPFGIIGTMANRCMVAKKIEHIFSHRREAILSYFSK